MLTGNYTTDHACLIRLDVGQSGTYSNSIIQNKLTADLKYYKIVRNLSNVAWVWPSVAARVEADRSATRVTVGEEITSPRN